MDDHAPVRSSRRTGTAAAGRTAAGVTGAACVCAVAWFGELSAGALVAVVATGLLVAGAGLVRRAGEAAAPVGRGALPWLAWLAALGAWEAFALAGPVPTVSDLLDPVLAHPLVRAAATAGWLAVGAWLVGRPAHAQRPG
jgi:hypothetical protein